MHVNLCDWEVVEPFDSFDYCVPNLLLRYSFLLSTVGMHVCERVDTDINTQKWVYL